MNIELTIGRQTTAAQTVHDAITTLDGYLRDLSDSVAASAPGFAGATAAAFGEALTAWFEAAGQLGPVLQQYAAALAIVDAEHAANEVVQQGTYGRLTQRLGEGS